MVRRLGPAALVPLFLLPASRAAGLDDGAVLLQVRDGGASAAARFAQAEGAAEMVNGLLSLMRGTFIGGQKTKLLPKERAIFHSGPAGCFRGDFKAWRQHMSQLLPTVEHGLLSIMLPKLIAKAKGEAVEVGEDSNNSTPAQERMQRELQEVMEPLREDMMPPECDQKLIKSKIMSQSIAGGVDAEEVTARCIVKSAHVSPACGRCASNFLHGFMGRGMVGLAASCVPKCMPANSACKKGLTDSCLTKAHPCLKCMKPGLLELSNCLGLNSTQWQISNKVDLLAKAFRDSSTDAAGVQRLADDIVLAINA